MLRRNLMVPFLLFLFRVPGVGYYNEDDVADFMIRLNTGPGFPMYYDSKVNHE